MCSSIKQLRLITYAMALVALCLLNRNDAMASTRYPFDAFSDGPPPGELWRDVDDAGVDYRTRSTWSQLNTYRLVEANVPALRSILTLAATGEQPPTQLTLPLPDGTNQRFHIKANTLMAPALAARYPEIQTYQGWGIDDPSATIRLDWSHRGLNAIILSVGGTSFVAPYRQGDVTQYVSYSSRALPSTMLAASSPQDSHSSFGSFWIQPHSTDYPVPETLQPAQPAAPARSNATLRTYRLAVATTGEYTQFYGGTKIGAMAAVTTLVNQLNAIFERELAINFVLVANNDQIIFLDPDTDPYGDNRSIAAAFENPSTLNAVIGVSNFDVGHVLGTFAGGWGNFGACIDDYKAQGASGNTYLEAEAITLYTFVHEIGHQFTATHTFNADNAGFCTVDGRNAVSAYEPGGGSTIMSYGGSCAEQSLQSSADMVFHTDSFERMLTYVNTVVSSCGSTTNTNNAPVVDAGATYIIPAWTPFALHGTASDSDGDVLTYSWEQFDLGNPPDTLQLPNLDDGSRPIFRSYPPALTPSRSFPSPHHSALASIGERLPTTNRTLTFRFTARDQRGGVAYDTTTLSVSTEAGPFAVTSPNALMATWTPGSQQTITWDVANTAQAPVNCTQVNITLSTDGGHTAGVLLAQNAPNTGQATVPVPAIPAAIRWIKVECADNLFFAQSEHPVRVCADIWHDDHEAAATLWEISNGSGANSWQLLEDGGFSGQKNWYVRDANDIFATDSYLISPPLKATENSVLLSFFHRHQLEATHIGANDAGVVEIQVNGGSWVDVGEGRFQRNGYTHIVRTDTNSALAGRPAFSGIAGEYYESIVNLESIAQPGDTFRIRFRQANDYWQMDYPTTLGWFVDDVTVCGANVRSETTVLTVTKTADTADGLCDADCSLREAVIAANVDTAIDRIIVPAGVYTLTIPGANETAGATGDLNLNLDFPATRAITISGAGPAITVIDANRLDRGLSISGGIIVLEGLTIRNGLTKVEGGGIWSRGSELTLRNCIVTQNRDEGGARGGGGIFLHGGNRFVIENSMVSHNWTNSSGGGVRAFAGHTTVRDSQIISNTGEYVGGMFVGGDGVITNSVFDSNYSVYGPGLSIGGGERFEMTDSSVSRNVGGGLDLVGEQTQVTLLRIRVNDNLVHGGIDNSNSIVTLIDSEVIGNRAQMGAGAGIANSEVMTISGSTVSENVNEMNGSGGIFNSSQLFLANSVVAHNTGSWGGGIANHGDARIENSQIISNTNTAGNGAGIYNAGVHTIVNSAISWNRNTAEYGEGGGIANESDAQMHLIGSTVSHNEATDQDGGGGALANFGVATIDASTLSTNISRGYGGGGVANWFHAQLTMTNSTISNNQALSGGELYNRGQGGGIINHGQVTLRNSTVASNHADNEGGGIAHRGATESPASTRYRNTILAGNTAGASVQENCHSSPVASTSVTSDGYNLSSDSSCNLNAPGDQSDIEPQLLPLGDYGGATYTRALAANSPARDAGNDCPATDQRGVARPQGAACDLGAFEWRAGETEPIVQGEIFLPMIAR